MKITCTRIISAALLAAAQGCTVHPPGEASERRAALAAGTPYTHRVEERSLPVLSADATPDELVACALLNNADLETQYWQWRSALEQVPQEGTQKTNLMISFNSMITSGATAAAMNTMSVGNSPMNSIVLPDKLEIAARAALEQARAAGLRFDQARFDLRAKVLSAYADYALTAQLIRLESSNHDLLQLILNVTESRLATSGAMQQDAYKAANEQELSTNELQTLKARLRPQLAVLNALLDRDPGAPLTPPAALPVAPTLPADDAAFLQQAAAQNRDLQALAREVASSTAGIDKAKAEYLPDFGISASTDLAGVTQSLMGAVMVPVIRYHAIDAEIRQAQANLHAAEAMRRQATHDVASRVIADLTAARDLDRQIALFQTTLIPRAQQAIDANQITYASGRSPFLDLLDTQRSLIALQRMLADFQTTRFKHIADLEAATDVLIR